MKYIIKQPAPHSFTEWKNLANEDWTPTYNNLQGEEKQAVLMSLKGEQGYICCYCERSLTIRDCHIEHLKPQGPDLYPENQLDYENLLCSCQLELDKGEPRHCGNSKESWYDDTLLISPLSQNCEQRFKYTHDGYIEPMADGDISAATTIEKLNLKADKLNALRRNAIEPFIGLTEEELNNFANAYLVDKAENDGRYNPFYTTIRYLFAE